MSESDPAYRLIIRGFEHIRIAPESYLNAMIDKAMN